MRLARFTPRIGASLGMVVGLLLALSSLGLAAEGDVAADRVLGQPDLFTDNCNPDGVSATSLCFPSDVAVQANGGRLYVSDTFNHRVLSWPSATSFTNGRPADLVIGQHDFTSAACNRGGAAAANTLCQPRGLAVDDAGNLHVVDTGNHRVLTFRSPGTSNTVADAVLGQASFSGTQCNRGGDAGAATLCNPMDVAVDHSRYLYVADTNNNRVLLFPNPLGRHADGVAARVYGHNVMTATGCNRNGSVRPDVLCFPSGVALRPGRGGRLYIADTANNRVLAFDAPMTSDKVTSQVIGQTDFFNRKGCNRDHEPTAGALCLPFGLAVDRFGNLFVADRNNSRILQYDNPGASDAIADRILGQSDPRNFACNGGESPASNNLCIPRGVAVDNSGDLYVADTGNNRVLAYDALIPRPRPRP